mgnify:FL=1
MREHLGSGGASFERNALARLFQNDTTTLIPRGIRSWRSHKDGAITVFVYEEEPTYRTIHYKHKGEGKEWLHQVWTPWLYYVIYVSAASAMITNLYMRKEQLRNSGDMLYLPSLPNVYASPTDTFGKVCYGEAEVRTEWSENQSVLHLDRTISAAVSAWWSAPFNKDILAFRDYDPFVTIARMAGPSDPGVDEITVMERGFEVWSKLTPDQFLTMPFTPIHTYEALMAQLEGSYGSGSSRPGQTLLRRITQALDPANSVRTPKMDALSYDLAARRYQISREARGAMGKRMGESEEAYVARRAAWAEEDQQYNALRRFRKSRNLTQG